MTAIEPSAGGTTRWNPWAALRQSRVALWFAVLDGERGRWERHHVEGSPAWGVPATRGVDATRDVVVLDARLRRRARQEVLAHELVHVERGVGWPHASAATMEVEEERVWRVALDRLAPPSEVQAFLERRGTVGAVTIADLAEEFDLSMEAAERVAALHAVRPRPAVRLGGRVASG